jgi:hypothetical protein
MILTCGEFEALVKEVRWLTLFRVHTSKPFSHATLFSALRNAWSAPKEVTFKVLAPNLFQAQLHCLGDWNRVMDGSPWLFIGAAIVMGEGRDVVHEGPKPWEGVSGLQNAAEDGGHHCQEDDDG